NAYRKSTGLPGKLPVSLLVTTYPPSLCSTARGLLVYAYFADAPAFHLSIAARPACARPSSLTTAALVKQRATAAASPRLSAAKYPAIGSGIFRVVMAVLLCCCRAIHCGSSERLENRL